MIKKILTASVLFVLVTPLLMRAQEINYFPDRLLIKYESAEKMSQVKSKIGTDPRQAVEQFLMMTGAREVNPLISGPMKQRLQQRNLPESKELLRIQEAVFANKIDPEFLAAKISRMPGVEYAEPKYLRELYYTPSDSILETFISRHNFYDAWDISQGSSDIVIAIVDAGVGYDHPDLDDKLWINQGEVPASIKSDVDQNDDGTVTSTEIKQYLQDNSGDYNENGSIELEDALHPDSPFMDNSDGDDNDFVDDLFGWDFWESGGFNNEPVETDNNPIYESEGTDHGTHVTGIAAAETDNGEGVAGAGFNSSYMAVKAGGIPDDPSTNLNESLIIGFGFNGILYAAEQGADVINCSWGGGGFSQAEQDVINFADEMGALVVGASGNQGVSQVGFPAGYDKVVAVGSVEGGNTVANYSNYGHNLDVLASGTDIQSTGFSTNYVQKTGTSMATPVVSGLATLLMDIHPDWSPERIGMQIRSSANNIYGVNSDSYANQLGHGVIDAAQALETPMPGIKIVSQRFENQNGEKLGLNQDGTMYIRLTNLGATVSGISLQIESLNDTGVQLSSTSQQISSMATGDTTEISVGITINDAFNLTEIPMFRANFSDSPQNYEDFTITRYDNFLYDELAVNRVSTSFAADGTIGFVDPFNAEGGIGFIPRPSTSDAFDTSDNVLFEGGLMLEYDGSLKSAVRSVNGQLSREFMPKQVFATQQGGVSDLDGHATFHTKEDTTQQMTINLETFVYDDPQLSNVVYAKYNIRNSSSYIVRENVYVGLFNDWDIGNAANNSTSYSAADSVLYLSHASPNSSQPIVAVAHMSPISGALAIDNPIEGQRDSLTFGLYDGFTDEEKKASMRAGTVRTDIQNSDVSAVNASGPYSLDPGAEITVGFIYAFGSDTDELRSQISNARAQAPFKVSPLGRAVSPEVPSQTKLHQNYPNPFNPTTQFRIDIEQASQVNLTIYDVLGRKVRVLIDGQLEARSHFIEFNGENLSSGVYFARLKTEQSVQTIPMTLIK